MLPLNLFFLKQGNEINEKGEEALLEAIKHNPSFEKCITGSKHISLFSFLFNTSPFVKQNNLFLKSYFPNEMDVSFNWIFEKKKKKKKKNSFSKVFYFGFF